MQDFAEDENLLNAIDGADRTPSATARHISAATIHGEFWDTSPHLSEAYHANTHRLRKGDETPLN